MCIKDHLNHSGKPSQTQRNQYFKNVAGAPQQDPNVEKEVLIKNVKIFNGTSGTLITGKDVVLLGNKINKIIPAGGSEEGYHEVIDGKGGYMTPGLVDVHVHITAGMSLDQFFYGFQEYNQIFSGMEMGEMLMRGVTTVRDPGGNCFGVKQAVDEGVIPGPRIYPSGALISQTSGHGDYRSVNTYMSNRPRAVGGGPFPAEEGGFSIIADGVDQCMIAVRQNLFLGATQVKICNTGGVDSLADPFFVVEYTAEEISAMVKVAADYGTYVLSHCHTGAGIIRAVENGVKCIEHGSNLTEDAAKAMADNDIVFVPNLEVLDQLKPVDAPNPIRMGKLNEAIEGTAASVELAKKHGLFMGFGTDLLLDPEGRKLQLHELTLRKQFFSSEEIMIQATGNNGKITAMCGKRNPYGTVGVIEEGALADILIYNQDPLKDVSVAEDFENNLKLIIKDGDVYKNAL